MIDGFEDCSDELLHEMAKTGLIGHIWSKDIMVSKIDFEEIQRNCKCNPIWERDGVRVDGPGNGADRVDVKCDWCQNQMKETSNE